MLRQDATMTLIALAVLTAVGGACAWFYDRSETIKWLGDTNLSVDFEVVAAETDAPVANARISILNEGSFYDGDDAERGKTIELRTDGQGMVHKLCPNNRCIGTLSGLRWTNSRVVYPPGWHVWVAADGFETTEWIGVVDQYRDKIAHIGVDEDRLTIRVALKK